MHIATRIAMLLLVAGLPATALAETSWEAYLRAPSPTTAAAVAKATYEIPDEDHRRFEHDLEILENEVAAGEGESVKLTIRLHDQFAQSADIAEYLTAILGRSIRSNPIAYLRAIASKQGCPGLVPTGDLYVDRTDARVAEAHARAKALSAVTLSPLRGKRDECLRIGARSMTANKSLERTRER